MNKGIIAINKPNGWTSFDVVNKLKHMLKPCKVGHLGTLDPMATGVLIVTVGSATKLFDLMQTKKKTYVATFNFGILTDTLDATGKVIESCEIKPISKKDIEDVLPKFIGKISQIPPMYSAKSVNGIRAYELARKGIEIQLKPKDVEVYNISILDNTSNSVTLEICCGSGTYIRALGRDIANELGTHATMSSLIRTKIDNFSINSCQDINSINKDNVQEFIIPINNVLNLDILTLNQIETKKILNGQTLNVSQPDGLYKLNSNDDTIAIVKINENIAKMTIFLG